MCGIVGYLGQKAPAPVLMHALAQLEYRGYDSAGLALHLHGQAQLQVLKAKGKLANLHNTLPPELLDAPDADAPQTGIGHIRWATHGAPTVENAHPHSSHHRRIVLVHNGIIENYADLKNSLMARGVVFASQTDTEVLAHRLEELLAEAKQANPQATLLQALPLLVQELKGAYALAVMDEQEPQTLYAVRQQAPLLLGQSTDTSHLLVASDTLAMTHLASSVLYMNDGQIAKLTPAGVVLIDTQGQACPQQWRPLPASQSAIDKGTFKHFMMKEIDEQPEVITNGLANRLIHPTHPISLVNDSAFTSTLAHQAPILPWLQGVRRLVIIGCGTSYNAALVGKYLIEDYVGLEVDVESAGEFRYRKPVLGKDTLLIALSQSGETADTLEALRQAKQKGVKTLCISNRDDSSMAREVDAVLHVRAGVEVSVCATKSFVAQVLVLTLLMLGLAEQPTVADLPADSLVHQPELRQQLKAELLALPAQLRHYLTEDAPHVATLAKQVAHVKHMLFMGRGLSYPVALEGALKLKEISYIHAEGYSAAELKHGPIALLDSDLPVVATLVPGVLFEKTLSNCQEAKARDAQLIGFSSVGEHEAYASVFDSVHPFVATHEVLSPLVSIVPLQLLAYHIAEHLGKDVDQPRNLAKSVTVE